MSKPIKEEDTYEIKAALADKAFQEDLALAEAVTESNVRANSEYLDSINAAKPRRHLEEAWEWASQKYPGSKSFEAQKSYGLQNGRYPSPLDVPYEWRDPRQIPNNPDRPHPPTRASQIPNKGRNTGDIPQSKPSRAANLAAAFANSVGTRPGTTDGKITPLIITPKEKDDSSFGLGDLLRAAKGVGNFIPGVNTVINAYDLIGALIDEHYGAAVYNTADLATDFALSLLPYNKVARGLSTAKNIVVPIYDDKGSKTVTVPLGPLRPAVNRLGKNIASRRLTTELDRTLNPKEGKVANYLQKQFLDWKYMWPLKLPIETGVNAAFYFNEPE